MLNMVYFGNLGLKRYKPSGIQNIKQDSSLTVKHVIATLEFLKLRTTHIVK